MLDQEEFYKKCDEGRCPRGTIYNKKTCSRNGKRGRCFTKYFTKDRTFEVDEEWIQVKNQIWKRDGGSCRLLSILTPEEFYKVDHLVKGATLDVAHVIRRSQSSKLYYHPSNLILLSRVFHSRLDQYKDPITGESTKNAMDWWIRIIGKDMWDWLQLHK